MAYLESMEVSHRVYKLAHECPVSGNDSNRLVEFHGLVGPKGIYPWQSYRDKKMLDVCAGLSDFTAKLLQSGADAYAIDLGYADIEELYLRSGNRPAGMFRRSFFQDRRRYVAGSSHNLPFESDSFDAVTSYYGLFGVLDDDFNLAMQSIDEAIRVLKPGGILSVGPLMDGDITPLQSENELRILDKLEDKDNIAIYVRNPRPKRLTWISSPSQTGKLTLIKNS
jgi:SAM-dependent methyltransferase